METKTVEEQFIKCPNCGKEVKIKIRKDTVMKNFPMFCTWIKEEILIDVEDLKVTLSKKYK